MSEFGERLVESAKQALEIAQGTAKPGTYRITQYDDDGNPTVTRRFQRRVSGANRCRNRRRARTRRKSQVSVN